VGIKDKLARECRNWNPSEDGQPQTVGGVVVSVDEREGYEGVLYTAVTVADEDEGCDMVAHCFHTTLRQDIAKYNPQPGDELAISYLGEQKNRKGKKYHAYRVAFERADHNASYAPAVAEVPDMPELDAEGAPF
jgi:hypothetical protein